jgi:hypothetical protein
VAVATTATKAPTNNKRKSAIDMLTMRETEEDGINNPKKRRQKKSVAAAEISGFSTTPFLKRLAPTVGKKGHPPDNSLKDSPQSQDVEQSRSELVIDIQPTRVFRTGANRKQQPKAVKPAQILEDVEVDGEAEDSILEQLGLTSTLNPKPKSKPTSKAKRTTAQEAAEQARILSLLDSPHDDEPQPPSDPVPLKKRRRKFVGEQSFMGIKPTLFEDIDGTGRLVDNLNTQETGDLHEFTKKEKNPLRIKPVISVLKGEISPRKARPAALNKIFGRV